MDTKQAVICVFTMLHLVLPLEAYIWNLAWSSQLRNDRAYTDNMPHPRNIRGYDRERSQLGDIEENTTERFVPCRSDKQCGRGKYCDKHYRTCEYQREEGDVCRRDGHCERGYDCMFGRCQKTIKGSQEGARCKHDRDCGASMCCARKHGEKICKRKLVVGQKCYVPNGGMTYSLNELCPCEEGLRCKDTSTKNQDEEDETWRFWTDFDHMRCAAL